MPDLPQIVVPAVLYNSILCSLIVMSCWQVINIADGVRRRVFARSRSEDGE